jgi:hypothetical protein
MTLGDDFEDLPFLQKLEFEHRRDVSDFFLRRANEGAMLFPPDPLATIAERIMQSAQVPVSPLRAVFEDLAADPQGRSLSLEQLCAAIQASGIEIVEIAPAVVELPERELMATIWAARKESFYKSVGVRLARTRR